MRLELITATLVNQAVQIYLDHAFDDESLREAHAVRFAPETDIGDVLNQFDKEDAHLRAYALRLGSQHYPHMKMALWEAYYPGEFVFAVDRHDGFDFDHTGPDYEAWLGIRSKNFGVKERIEDAWFEAGIPTLRQLKADRLSESDIMRAFSGQNVLVVDNDADAGAIIEMILMRSGYGCIWKRGVQETCAYLEDEVNRKACGIALVDVMLSDGHGLEIVKALRARSDTMEIPIVLTSAMPPADVDLSGTDGYLQKPYSAQDLLDAVKLTLRQRYDGHDQIVTRQEEKKN